MKSVLLNDKSELSGGLMLKTLDECLERSQNPRNMEFAEPDLKLFCLGTVPS